MTNPSHSEMVTAKEVGLPNENFPVHRTIPAGSGWRGGNQQVCVAAYLWIRGSSQTRVLGKNATELTVATVADDAFSMGYVVQRVSRSHVTSRLQKRQAVSLSQNA